MDELRFMEKDGKPFCSRDFYHLFAPKCSGSGQSNLAPRLLRLFRVFKAFLRRLFSCTITPHRELCVGAAEPVSGRCIAALQRKFHPKHFLCAFCLPQPSQGGFKEQGGKPYCSVCHSKLFL